MAVSLGTAYVTIEPETKGFGKDIERELEHEIGPAADKVNAKIGDGISGAMRKVGTAIAAAGVGAFFKSTIDAAGDLNEQVSKVGVVFGDSADEVLAFGKSAVTSIGASEAEALTAAATFGNLFRSVGLSSKAAAGMSVEMVQLAGDLASFNNVPVGDALDAIRSGLVGETEPLKRFGVNLNEAALNAEAMRLGLDTSGSSLNAASKAQAAYSIILKQTTLAQGDFARTSDSLANQQRILSAEFANAKADIGQALLPAMLSIVKAGSDLIPLLTTVGTTIGTVASSAAPLVGVLADIAGSGVGSTLLVIAGTAGAAFYGLSKLVDIAKRAQETIATLGTTMSTTNVVLAGIGIALGVAAAAWTAFRGEQEAARKAQEAFNKAVLVSGDPVAQLGAKYEKLAGSMAVVTLEAGGTVQSLEDVVSLSLTKKLNDDTEALGHFGLTFQQVQQLVRDGGKGYEDLIFRLDQAGRGYNVNAAGARALAEDLVNTRHEIESNRDSIADQIVEGLNWLVLNEKLSESDKARVAALADSNNRTDEAIALGQEFAPTLEKVATSADTISPAVDKAAAAVDGLIVKQTDAEKHATALSEAEKRATDATAKKADAVADAAIKYSLSWDSAQRLIDVEEDEKEATDAQKKAKDELTAAIDAAAKAQENYLFVSGGAQVQVDDVTTSTRELTKSMIEGADAAGRDADAFAGNTDAAISNREALQTVKERAQAVVNGYDDLGYSSDQAAAAQLNLANDMAETARQAGATEQEANAVRDAIIGIPPEKKSTITAEAHTAEAQAKLDQLEAERQAIITAEVRVNWSGLTMQEHALMAAGGNISALAEGALVRHRPGGTLARIGEGVHDEAVVPMGPDFASNLARIVGSKAMAALGPTQVGQSGPVINVNISGTGPADGADARRLGRIVGESAAQVLAHRQLLTAIRVG